MFINLYVRIYNFKTCYFIKGNGAIFYVSLAQFCNFLIQSCIEVTSL